MPRPDVREDRLFTVAIDGPSGSGKGTLAQKLSEALNFAHLDTGAVYRAVALEAVRNNTDPADKDAILDAAETVKGNFCISIAKDPAIRTEEISVLTSKISALPEVREALLEIQRNFCKGIYFKEDERFRGVIIDGRDIGTIVCQDAEIKFFITADPEVRAKRRVEQLKNSGYSNKDINYETVLYDILQRDKRDMSRTLAPLKPAEDAIFIDSGHKTSAQVAEEALSFINKVFQKK